MDGLNLPMPHQSGLEIAGVAVQRCQTNASLWQSGLKRKENQSVFSSLREDGAAGVSWANRLLTTLTLLEPGRHFGGPGYSRAIPSAVPARGLSQERADLAGKDGAGTPYPWLWLTKSRSCGAEFTESLFRGCARGSGVLGVSSSGSKGWCLGQDGKVSCRGKHREEVSVSCLDQSLLSLSAPGQGGRPLCHSETAPAKGSLSPPSVLILQNPEFLRSAEHPWLPPAAPVPSPVLC